MHDVKFVQVLYPRNEFLEKLASLELGEFGVFDYKIKELAPFAKLHDQENVFLGFNNLLKTGLLHRAE